MNPTGAAPNAIMTCSITPIPANASITPILTLFDEELSPSLVLLLLANLLIPCPYEAEPLEGSVCGSISTLGDLARLVPVLLLASHMVESFATLALNSFEN